MSAREDLLRYLIRYGAVCRDCADENGVCPQTGIGCGERRKATEFFVEALEYGTKHGFAAGHRLLAPGELDDGTLKRAAEAVEAMRWYRHTSPDHIVVNRPKDYASAIRSLTPGSMEGKE